MRFINQSVIIFLVIISLFLAGCNDRRMRGGGRGGFAPSTAIPARRTLPPLPRRALSPELQAIRARIAGSVTNVRELEWQDEVGMIELSGWEYGTRTREMAEVLGGDDLRALSRLATAAGALPEGTDLATLAAGFASSAASATYSPLDRQVLLLPRQTQSESGNDSLIAHEFVHALQDQHFDLLPLLLARPFNFDRTEAMFAVVEGDAVSVQRRFESGEAWTRRTLEEVWRQEDGNFVDLRREVGEIFPPLLTETFIFRYRDGVRFVEAVRRARGQAGIDELFRRPPASTEHILHPEKYLATSGRDEPREASVNEEAFTERGWQTSASTPLGELGIRGLLMAGRSSNDAARAASGWGGDRAYLFEQTGRAPLFVWTTVWDRAEDAAEFYRAYTAGQGQTAQTGALPDEAQTLWRARGMTTFVFRSGDRVIVFRGAEADVNAAREIM
jgi:predicted small secreted protein